MKILIVKLSAIGDVVHTMPLAAALRKLFPAAIIHWLVEEEAAALLVGYAQIDKLLISPRKSLIKELKAGKLGKAAKLVKGFITTMRAQVEHGGEYDIIIDAHGLLKSAVLVGMLKAKRKIGYNSLQEGSGLFYTEKIFEDFSKHAVDRYLDFAVYLGAVSDTASVTAPGLATVTAPGLATATTSGTATGVVSNVAEFSINIVGSNIVPLLSEKGIGAQETFIAFSPHALWRTKLWEERKFAELADLISERLGWKVVLTGKNSNETSQIEKIAKNSLVNVAGCTDLRDLAALYRRAALVVSTDSGPMHIAAAMGTPVVAIFGPTDAKRTGPYGSKHIVISAAVACRPCLLKKCDSRICMKEITVEDVFAAIKGILIKK